MYKRNTFFLLLVFQTLIIDLYAQQALKPEEISKLVPDKVKGFYDDGDSKSSLVKMGDLRYSLCERRFVRGKQKIMILLFDYKEAGIMYKQAMRRWNSELVETDSLILRNITMANCVGWESYSRQNATSQIFLGVCDRFFLMISAENMELDKLKEVATLFNFEKFPK